MGNVLAVIILLSTLAAPAYFFIQDARKSSGGKFVCMVLGALTCVFLFALFASAVIKAPQKRPGRRVSGAEILRAHRAGTAQRSGNDDQKVERKNKGNQSLRKTLSEYHIMFSQQPVYLQVAIGILLAIAAIIVLLLAIALLINTLLLLLSLLIRLDKATENDKRA